MKSRFFAIALSILTLASCATETAKKNVPTEHTVEIAQFTFSPAELFINPGDRVTWINRDVVAHNVMGDLPNTEVRSGDLLKDEAFSIVLTKDFSYLCSLHEAVMKGKVSIRSQAGNEG